MPEFKEPLLVTTLRQQIRRGAATSLLVRLAGGEAEYQRLVYLYDLHGTARPAVAVQPETQTSALATEDFESLPEGQAKLLDMVIHLAEIGEQFPGAVALAEVLDCSWLVVERDLRRLARKRLISVSSLRKGDRGIRRVKIVGTTLATAIPG